MQCRGRMQSTGSTNYPVNGLSRLISSSSFAWGIVFQYLSLTNCQPTNDPSAATIHFNYDQSDDRVGAAYFLSTPFYRIS